ncbi:MAG: N-acetylmuramoyl-L-alanine amidase, partial [Myxococcota bacterium]
MLMFRLSLLIPLCLTAHAAPVDVDDPALLTTPVVEDGRWSPVLSEADVDELDPGAIDQLLEDLAHRAPAEALSIDPVVQTDRGLVRLEEWLPDALPVPTKGSTTATQTPPPGRPVDHVGKADGALSGKGVYLSQCHGFNYFETLDRWSTQRGNLFETVEDFHNPEGMNQFLSAYLENAGANVFTVKERDHNPLMAIVDNGDAGYSETGDGFTDGAPGFANRGRWAYGDAVFRAGSTRLMPADGGGVASWSINAPKDGTYAVYISWETDANNASDAHYRITHPGGVIDRTFDQRVHGSTWQYVEQLYLRATEPLVIELIGDSQESGKNLSIDAVRIGGGMGVIERYGELTGRPRWEENAIISTQFNGAPASIYDPYGDGSDGSDPTSRSRWAAWEHPSGEDAVYLSWHSNATANGSARGTVTYVYSGSAGQALPASSDLAWAVQEEMIESFQTLWEPGWLDRGVKTGAFAEVNPRHNNEMPATLVELAFHDNETDVAYIKQPRFRLDASRAMYRGIVRYFAEKDGQTPIYLPEPPIGLRTQHTPDGDVELSWQPGQVGSPFGDAPTDYLVQLSDDGLVWTTGFAVSGTSTLLDLEPGAHTLARVVASNAGGLSFASEVVGAVRSPNGVPAVLIVDAFDRFDAGQMRWEEVQWSIGRVRRMEAWRINNHDIIARHGDAVRRAGWPYDSVSD